MNSIRFALLLAVVAAPLYCQFLKPSANGRYLIREKDGKPFLWIGDTAWFASVKATPREWADYLDHRKRQGFTVVQLSAGRVPADWKGVMPFDAAGKPNDAYWNRIAAMAKAANRRGIVVLLVGLGRPTDPADLPRVQTPEYARYIVRKFAGMQVILSPNFDDMYKPVYDTVAENLVTAGTKLPLTQHPGTRKGQNEIYVPRSYLTFTGLQSGHHNGRLEMTYGAAREWPRALWAMTPVRPVINIEGMYDGRGSNDGPGWRGSDVRKLGWISWLSGAFGYTYGAGETGRKVPGTAGGVWGWNQDEAAFDHWRQAMAWPSSSTMTVMRDFFGSIDWWTLEPAHGLIRQEGTPDNQHRAVFAANADRRLAVAYAPAGGRFQLDLSAFPQSLRAEWVDPVTGKRTAARMGEWFQPPAGTDDVALVLQVGER